MPRITIDLTDKQYLQLQLLNRAHNERAARQSGAAPTPIEVDAARALEAGMRYRTRAWYIGELMDGVRDIDARVALEAEVG